MIAGIAARLGCRMIAGALFRVRIAGGEHIPARGPALLVSNHLTHLDGFLIGSCVRPPVRFLVWKSYYDHLVWRWPLRMAGCIPVWPGHRSVAQAIRQAREALRRGDVVCIFAEGSISRTGGILPFERGMEAIARDLQVPVVPVHLGGLWECIFSYRGGRFFWKWPRHLRHPVSVSFGAPLPASARAHEVRNAVVELETRAPGIR